MEQLDEYSALLGLIERPAFCTCDGIIVLANAAARKRQIAVGTEISAFLPPDAPVTAPPPEGYLYLPLTIFECTCGASVLQLKDKQIFILEDERADTRLEALALASQQLRTPLSGVMTTVERLSEHENLTQDPRFQTHMAQIQQRLFQLQRMVTNMTDAYRYSLDGEARMETVNLTSFFHEILDQAQQLAVETAHTLRCSVPRQAVFSMADREMLERAVYNLLSNAIKFSPAGSTITANLTQQGSTLYFTLRDEGEGVCRDLLGDVFSRYSRQPGIEDGRYGLGLGMVLARTAALAHSGTLLIEQPNGQGLKVTMTIPIRQSSQNTVRMRILAVDPFGERQHGLMELSDVLPPELFNETN